MEENPTVGAAQTLLIDWNAANFVESLAEEGIPSILLKGPSLAKWLYDAASPRYYADADVLVPESELPRAEQVLISLDFVRAPDLPHDRPVHAFEWKKGFAGIDLHRTVGGAGASPAEVWEILSKRTVEEEIAGRPMPCLDHEARAMHVVLHAAWHGSRGGKSLEDLARALDRIEPSRWKAVRDLAAELDALPAFGAGLGLCSRGIQVAAGLGLEQPAAVDTMLRASSAPPTSLGVAWFLRLPGWSKKSAFLFHKLFPPPEYMRVRSQMARRGGLGLALAYMRQPFWHLRKLGPAVRGYMRARRSLRRR